MLTVATGNKAVAAAVKEAAPAVVAAYPITPQTEIVEQIAEYVSSGELRSQYIPVESEHSAMAACIGASVTGARTFTATSSQGLQYMHEMVNWAAGARLPIVMANVNRALGPGWNIWAEHTDAIQERDSGWLQVYVGSVQEAFDAVLMAFAIAEDERVLLPVMVNLDGFLLSHTMQPFEVARAGDFIPPLHLPHAIDPAAPGGYGTLTGPEDYFKLRWDIERSMRDSAGVIRETQERFARTFGRKYGMAEEYRCEDAEVVVVAMGTLGREAEVAVDSSGGGDPGRQHAGPVVPAFPAARSFRAGRRRHRPRLLVRVRRGPGREPRRGGRCQALQRHCRARWPGGHVRGHRRVRPGEKAGRGVLVRGERRCLRSAFTPAAAREG